MKQSLEQKLTGLGKRLAPRQAWALSTRHALAARAHGSRHAFAPVRFALNLPVLFPRLTSTMGAAFMAVMALTVSVNAARESLPGNRFYALKRTIERVELKTASSESKSQIQFSQAGRRLQEAGVLAVTTPNSPKIKESLEEFRTHVVQTTKEIADQKSTPAVREELAKTVADKSADYNKVLSAAQVVVAPALKRETLEAKRVVALSTAQAVETLVGKSKTGEQTLSDELKDRLKDQVAALKSDAVDAGVVVPGMAPAESRIKATIIDQAKETIGTAQYLMEKGDYLEAAAKMRQTVTFMAQLDVQTKDDTSVIAIPPLEVVK